MRSTVYQINRVVFVIYSQIMMMILSRPVRLAAAISLLVSLQDQASAFQETPVLVLPQKHQKQNRYYSARNSPLWSAASSDENTNDDQMNSLHPKNSDRKRKRDMLSSVLLQPKKTVFQALRTVWTKGKIPLKDETKLRKWIGSFLVAAALAFGLLFGQPSSFESSANKKPLMTAYEQNPITSVLVQPVSPSATKAAAASANAKATEIPYSQFMDDCVHHKRRFHLGTRKGITSVQIEPGGSQLSFFRDGALNNTNIIEGMTTDRLIDFLHQHRVPFSSATRRAQARLLPSTLNSSGGGGDWSTTVVAGGIGFYMYQQGAFSSLTLKGKGGRSKQAVASNGRSTTSTKTSFDDIEGIGEAKDAVLELVDSLRNPEKYSLVGARAPTGLLLEGPPGTGKTTLARAAASLADVPFLSASGSEFVEKYVGQGAARVRQLFEKAEKLSQKEKRPVIVFIDEIDALGKARGGGGSAGGSDGTSQESEHTLIQLLASMDGLDSSSMICVLGATNRKDVLDKALVRPGRFDRIVKVDLPDASGREAILRVHAQKLLGFWEGSGVDQSCERSLGRGKRVDLSAIAAATEGLSGAELEMIVNEAAIRAVRRVSKQLDDGVDKHAIDTTVYPCDFEASVENFYQSRHEDKQRNTKQFGFDVGSSTVQNSSISLSRKIFYRAGSEAPPP